MKKTIVKIMILTFLVLLTIPIILAQTPLCGNEITEQGEECDDGNLVDGDGCSSVCLIESLGGGGTVNGTGAPPVLENVWVLPDDDPNSGDGLTNLDVLPGQERTDIYACMVASDENGRDSLRKAFVKIYHPDGTFKYQAHARQLDPVTDEQEIRDCVDDAYNAGLISWEEAYNELPFDGIVYNIFNQHNWHMYKVYLPMYYHQPNGIYELKGWVTDQTSAISDEYSEPFEWVPGTHLALDFTTVSFGSIEALSWKIANGDNDFGTPEYPTLKNNGNTELAIGVEFSDFVGVDYGKIINDFDAQLRGIGSANSYNDIVGEHFEFSSNFVQNFTWPIELCRQEKIDFSIHADTGVIPDTYEGDITIIATGVDVYGVGEPPVDDNGDSLEFDGYHALNPTE